MREDLLLPIGLLVFADAMGTPISNLDNISIILQAITSVNISFGRKLLRIGKVGTSS